MVKSFNDNPRGSFRGNNNRGGGFSRGGGNQRGGGGNRFDQGPPSYVIPYCTFEHPCEQQVVLKVTDLTRVPKFNRGVYLETKARIGTVDEIFGSINSYYFSLKLDEGIKAASFKKGQTLYMNPEDLLPLDRFTQKSKPQPRTGGPQGGQRGGPRGGPRGAPRGNFRGGAPRGNFRGGAPRGNFRGRQ